jgi:integrase
MASGCVVEYKGKRGKVFRIKFTDASGKQVMQTLGPARDPKVHPEGLTRREAEQALADRLSDVRRNGYRRPKPLRFTEVAQDWYDDPAVQREWRRSTKRQYAAPLKRLKEAFRSLKLEEVRPRHVAEYRDKHLARYAAATVSRDLTILGEIFSWAIGRELCERNVAREVKRPKVRQRQGHDLSPADVQLLLRSFDDEQARLAFLTFCLTGIRKAELAAIRWRDVDLIENRLTIPYSKTETGVRVVAIPTQLAEQLWQHRRCSNFRGDDERVFCHPQRGSEYHITKYKPALERAFRKASLEWPEGFRPCHDLRVTAITTDARNGTDPIAIMANAGHASYSTTKRYVKLAGVVFPDAAAARAERLLSTDSSTDLSRPEPHSGNATALNQAESTPIAAA